MSKRKVKLTKDEFLTLIKQRSPPVASFLKPTQEALRALGTIRLSSEKPPQLIFDLLQHRQWWLCVRGPSPRTGRVRPLLFLLFFSFNAINNIHQWCSVVEVAGWKAGRCAQLFLNDQDKAAILSLLLIHEEEETKETTA